MVLSDANNYYSTEKVIQQKSAVSKRIATQRDDGPLHVNISNCYDYCPRIMARTEDLLYWMEHCQVYNILGVCVWRIRNTVSVKPYRCNRIDCQF